MLKFSPPGLSATHSIPVPMSRIPSSLTSSQASSTVSLRGSSKPSTKVVPPLGAGTCTTEGPDQLLSAAPASGSAEENSMSAVSRSGSAERR